MQTFLLDIDFVTSATMLDSARLNKQSMECHQIYQVLLGESKAWAYHPVIKMWENNLVSFLSYCYSIVSECDKREIKSPYIEYFKTTGVDKQNAVDNPTWLDEDFINRHRMALLFKTALKDAVYDYSFMNDVNVIDVHRDDAFVKFIDRKNTNLKSSDVIKQYPVGKPIYKYKRVATIPMIARSCVDYNDYKLNFGDIPYKIDYRWG